MKTNSVKLIILPFMNILAFGCSSPPTKTESTEQTIPSLTQQEMFSISSTAVTGFNVLGLTYYSFEQMFEGAIKDIKEYKYEDYSNKK